MGDDDGNRPKRYQTCRLGPRFVLFFSFFFPVLMFIFINYPYIHHQPSPCRSITCDGYGHHQPPPTVATYSNDNRGGLETVDATCLEPTVAVLMMKTGPNDVSDVVWALGTSFFVLCVFFIYYTMIYIIFRFYLCFEP